MPLFPEPTTLWVIPNHIARYHDLMALSPRPPACTVTARVRSCATVRGSRCNACRSDQSPPTPTTLPKHEVLMPMRGHWRLTWDGGTTAL